MSVAAERIIEDLTVSQAQLRADAERCENQLHAAAVALARAHVELVAAAAAAREARFVTPHIRDTLVELEETHRARRISVEYWKSARDAAWAKLEAEERPQ